MWCDSRLAAMTASFQQHFGIKTNIAMERVPIFPGKYYQNGGSSSQAVLVDPKSVCPP